jgi:hypothetical protein
MSLVKIQSNASGTGTLTIAAPNTNTDYTLTLPTATGTVQVSGAAISGTTGSFSGDLSFNSGYGSAAVAYGCRAWVNFDGTSNSANLSGTYSQSGTTVTVTATAHGLIAGNSIYSDITSGTGVDGVYTVATVTDANTFTYTAGTSLTTSGNITLRRNTIRASGNVSSVTDNGTGDYTVNFTTAMPDANYAVAFSSESTGLGVASRNPGEIQSRTTTTVRYYVLSGGSSTTAYDTPSSNCVIFR